MVDLSALSALANKCSRCGGAHSTTLCGPREIAARMLGRGETLETAAAASHLSIVLIRHWAAIDAEFRAQVERARAKRPQPGDAA